MAPPPAGFSFGYWLLILMAGAVGGLLHSIEDNHLGFPTRTKNGTTWDPGFLGDVLFGVAGGLVVFTLMPEIQEPSTTMDYVKITALALVGGYSGKLLLDKAAHEKIKAIQGKMEQLELDKADEATALQLIYQTIDKNNFEDLSDAALAEQEHEIETVLEAASSAVVTQGISIVEMAREQIILSLLQIPSQESHNADAAAAVTSRRDILKKRLRNFVPLLKGLIQTEEKNLPEGMAKDIHHHYASLAYLYKDQYESDWDTANNYLSKAIASYELTHDPSSVPPIYYFNKLIICLNVTSPEERCSERMRHEYFNKVWNSDARYMIVTCNELIAPGLEAWVKQYHLNELTAYVTQHETSLSSEIIAKWRASAAWQQQVQQECCSAGDTCVEREEGSG